MFLYCLPSFVLNNMPFNSIVVELLYTYFKNTQTHYHNHSQVYSSVVFITLYSHCWAADLRTSSFWKTETILIKQHFLVPLPQPLVTTILHFPPMNLTTLDISDKWNHTVFVLWLAYFTKPDVQWFVQIVACNRISFLVSLNNIPLYV